MMTHTKLQEQQQERSTRSRSRSSRMMKLCSSPSPSAFSSLSSSSSVDDERQEKMKQEEKENENENEEESEVERLLRKAKMLREQASKAEQEIHSQLLTKKQKHNEHIDDLIDNYLFVVDGIGVFVDNDENVDVNVVAERLKMKKVSKDTLEDIVERLDDKLMIAEGKEHVCANASHSTTAATSSSSSSSSNNSNSNNNNNVFERVTKPRDTKTMVIIQNRIDCLLNAVRLLDEEFRNEHASTVTGSKSKEFGLYSTTSTEHNHWGGGHLYDELSSKLHEKQRERHVQFLKRQQEFIDAQTINQEQHGKNKNVHHPKKAKDDHGFLPWKCQTKYTKTREERERERG